MHRFTNVFMTLWLGFCVLWTVMVLLTSLADPTSWWMSLAGAGMFGLGAGFVVFGKSLGASDIEWLTSYLRSSLQ